MLADHLTTINKEYKNLETGDSRYICLNELDKACFQHDIAYEKDLPWITASDKILRDKAFIIAFNKASETPKYEWHQKSLASIVSKVFDKKSNLLT